VQAMSATFFGLPAARRRRSNARMTGFRRVATSVPMYRTARTGARPPQIRLPRRVPLSRARGATPTAWGWESLNRADVGARFQEMYGERVTEGMWRNRFGNATAPMGLPAGPVHRAGGDRLSGAIAGKQPGAGSAHPPPLAQEGQRCRREHDVAILLPFALRDAQDHPLTVNRGRRESHGFRDAEACGIADRQDRAMLGRRDAVEEQGDFAGAEHHGQRLPRFWRRDHGLDRPRFLERGLHEKRPP
jgi:hypothetical protein